jgi:tetratricopeptide (TPR) repeat protein
MTNDPYQPCPCGSGEKFKWCCQPLAKYVEKAGALLQGKQHEAALQALDEGLAVDASNVWLRLTKSELLVHLERYAEASAIVESLLADRPGNVRALDQRTLLQAGRGEWPEAVVTLQRLWENAHSANDRRLVLDRFVVIGTALCRAGHFMAGLWCLRTGAQEESAVESPARQELAACESNADIAPWLRDIYELLPPPPGEAALAETWQHALDSANRGLLDPALDAFTRLVQDRPDLRDAQFNRGLCLAWLAREQEAAEALHQFALQEPDLPRAIDIDALAQTMWHRGSAQTVDVCRAVYPLRDRARLLSRLSDEPLWTSTRQPDGNEDSAAGDGGAWLRLSRPLPSRMDDAGWIDDPPHVVADLVIGPERVQLTFGEARQDDDRLTQFEELARECVDIEARTVQMTPAPASVVRSLSRYVMSGVHDVSVAAGKAQRRRFLTTVWPDIPQGWLENKTPREAAHDPALRTTLQAMLRTREHEMERDGDVPDTSELRAELGVEAGPPYVGPSDGDWTKVPLDRLRDINPAPLGDDAIQALWELAEAYRLPHARVRVAQEMIGRPSLEPMLRYEAMLTLLLASAVNGDRGLAADCLSRGRACDEQVGNPMAVWDLLALYPTALVEPALTWILQLEALSQTGSGDPFSMVLNRLLLDTGLVRPALVRDKDDPSQARLTPDTSRLVAVLEEACRQAAAPGVGGIWTPQSAAAPGKVWAPGQDQPKPPAGRLWVPGS